MSNFSKECKEVVVNAQRYAATSGGLLGTEHLLMGMVTAKGCRAYQILKKYGVTESSLQGLIVSNGTTVGNIELSNRVQSIFRYAKSIAGSIGEDAISSDALLYAMFAEPESVGVRAIASIADAESIKNTTARSLLSGEFEGGEEEEDEENVVNSDNSFGTSQQSSRVRKLPETLLKFGSDLTERRRRASWILSSAEARRSKG